MTEVVTLGLIVEGHGEVQAAPLLVWNYLRITGRYVNIPKPVRVHRSRLGEKFPDVERAVRLMVLKPVDVLLLLADIDDECAATEGPALFARMEQVANGIPVSAVFACREYEGWFLAGLASLRGHRNLAIDAVFEGDCEAVRGAKEALSRYMPREYPYSETVDQPAFSSRLDIQAARPRAPSLDKLCRELDRIIPG